MDKKRIFSSLSLSSLVVLGVFLVRGSVTSALGGRSFAGENLCNFFLSFQRKPALPPHPQPQLLPVTARRRKIPSALIARSLVAV